MVNMCIVDMRMVFARAKVNITKRNVRGVTRGKPETCPPETKMIY
jgi:hypothetical protein